MFYWYTKQRRKKNGQNRPKKGLKPKVFMHINPETMTQLFTKKKISLQNPFQPDAIPASRLKSVDVPCEIYICWDILSTLSLSFPNILIKSKRQLQRYFCWTMYSKLPPLPFPHQPYAVLIQSIYPFKLSFTFLNIMAFWNMKLCISKFYLRLNFY